MMYAGDEFYGDEVTSRMLPEERRVPRCEYGHWQCTPPCQVRCAGCGELVARTYTTCGGCGVRMCKACDDAHYAACERIHGEES